MGGRHADQPVHAVALRGGPGDRAACKQIGGAGIVALHLANFVKEVHCITNGLTAALPSNVSVTNLAAGELVETRFVDRDTGHPVFKSKSRDLSEHRA